MRRAVILSLMTCTLLLAGCRGAGLTQADVSRLAATPYPAEAPYGDDLEILARQRGGQLRLSNRTPRSYQNVQLWLNQQYVADARRIRVGADWDRNEFPLRRFINAHREPYPVGGPLTPDRGFPVVLAELFDPASGQRHRLLVRRGD